MKLSALWLHIPHEIGSQLYFALYGFQVKPRKKLILLSMRRGTPGTLRCHAFYIADVASSLLAAYFLVPLSGLTCGLPSVPFFFQQLYGTLAAEIYLLLAFQ